MPETEILDEQGDKDHTVPAQLLELYEILEYEAAIRALEAGGSPMTRSPVVGSIRSRREWGARPPKSITRLNNPPLVTFHYVGPPTGSFGHDRCDARVRGIQSFHMDGQGWSDGAYSGIVCPHGVVYELRGPDVRTAANGTNTGNSQSLALCALIGDGDRVTDELLHGLAAGRRWLMSHGTGGGVRSHRDWKSTSCPGDPLNRWQKAGMPLPGGGQPAPPPPPPPPPPPHGVLHSPAEFVSHHVPPGSVTPDGYVICGADGGVFAFPSSLYKGSLPGIGVRPAAPIVALCWTHTGQGYWLVGADGGVFAFGDAPALPSYSGHLAPGRTVRGASSSPDPHGAGLVMVQDDGGIITLGGVKFFGSVGA